MSLYTREDVCRFEIEPELAQPCPRRVRAPRRWLALTVAAACGYALAALIANAVVLRSGEMLWLSRCGQLQQARLIGYEELTPAYTGEDSIASLLPTVLADSADDVTGRVRENYAFLLDGHLHHGSAAVADDEYNAPIAASAPVAQLSAAKPQPPLSSAYGADRAQRLPTVPVLTGWWLGRFVYRPLDMMPSTLSSFLLAAAGSLTLLLVVWSAATRGRRLLSVYRLLRHGDALTATIRDKEITPNGKSHYWVTCGFIALNGTIVSYRERCTPEQWRALQIGDAVTILHLPAASDAAGVTAALYNHLRLTCASRPNALLPAGQRG